MHILVTGGAGFIGGRLAQTLVEDGHKVDVLDNLSTGSRENIPSEARFIHGDIRNREKLMAEFNRYDRVYHLAGNVGVSTQNFDRDKDVRNNIVGTHNLLEAMYEYQVHDMVFVSSSTVYGEDVQKPTSEDSTPLRPISLYSASKLSAEKLISVYVNSFGFKATILRPANVVGGGANYGVIYDFVEKLRGDDSRLQVLGDGSQRKPYLHIGDCIEAIRAAVSNRKQPFEVFNIANESPISVSKMAEIVIEEFGCDADIEYEDRKRGWKGDITEIDLDTTKIRDLGWEPAMTSEETVRCTVRELLSGDLKMKAEV